MGSIGIVGLEGGPADALPHGARERLEAADVVVVPSAEGEAAAVVRAMDIVPTPFAELGIAPSAPAGAVVEALTDVAKDRDVVLATTGFPFLRAGVVSGLLDRSAQGVEVFPVDSPLGVLVLALDIDLTADLDIVDVSALPARSAPRGTHLIVTGVRNRVLARKAGEALARDRSGAHPVVVAGCVDGAGFDLRMATVESLQDVDGLCEESSVYVPPTGIEPPGGFDDLVRLIAVLRGPDGCPWDREQTAMSLRSHVIEEAYETLAAIETGESEGLADELGDLLLQIVLQAQIASEEGTFDIDDVTAGIVRKLRRRHPHIFGGVEVEDAAEVSRNWDAIKRGEKDVESALDGVPAGLPSLARAQKISRRAVGVGFEWETIEDVWAKVHEEIEELKAAHAADEHIAEEVGDVLFTMVNVARKLGVDAEIALRDACDKFTRRFTSMEVAAAGEGTGLTEMTTAEMERLWHDAKQEERAGGAETGEGDR